MGAVSQVTGAGGLASPAQGEPKLSRPSRSYYDAIWQITLDRHFRLYRASFNQGLID